MAAIGWNLKASSRVTGMRLLTALVIGNSQPLLLGIYTYDFEKPSAIQQQAILPCIKGYDVIAQAQSGTGKTASFAISILQQIELDLKAT